MSAVAQIELPHITEMIKLNFGATLLNILIVTLDARPSEPDSKLKIERRDKKKFGIIEMNVPWTDNRKERF